MVSRLLGEDPVHQIADGNHADEALPLQHRKMADAMVRDDLHAFADGVIGRDGDDRRTHDLGDRGFPGRAPLEDHFAGIVALGDDAHDPALEDHQQGADLLFRHHGDGHHKRSPTGETEQTRPLFCFRMGRIDSVRCKSRLLGNQDDTSFPSFLESLLKISSMTLRSLSRAAG